VGAGRFLCVAQKGDMPHTPASETPSASSHVTTLVNHRSEAPTPHIPRFSLLLLLPFSNPPPLYNLHPIPAHFCS